MQPLRAIRLFGIILFMGSLLRAVAAAPILTEEGVFNFILNDQADSSSVSRGIIHDSSERTGDGLSWTNNMDHERGLPGDDRTILPRVKSVNKAECVTFYARDGMETSVEGKEIYARGKGC